MAKHPLPEKCLANPAYPWYVAGATTALALVVTIFFIRDPQRAEA